MQYINDTYVEDTDKIDANMRLRLNNGIHTLNLTIHIYKPNAGPRKQMETHPENTFASIKNMII